LKNSNLKEKFMASSSMIYLENKIKEKAVEDNNFRKSLMANPKEALKKEMNINVPDDINIKVVEDSAKTVYIVLPPSSGEESIGVW
jgi:hypothetical protein